VSAPNGGPPDAASSANPTDTTLRSVVDALTDQGYTGQFAARPGGRVECLVCRADAPAHRYHADEVTRLEGVSDPDDMVMVAPLRCRSCGALGTLVLGYGPEASEDDSDVLVALERTPSAPIDPQRSDSPTPAPGLN
jgi:hypothetical protein